MRLFKLKSSLRFWRRNVNSIQLIERLKTKLKSLEDVRFILFGYMVAIIPFNFTTNFIVIPCLSLFLLIVKHRSDFSFRIFRISQTALILSSIFVLHLFWFVPYILATLSFGYVERTLPLLAFPLMISSTVIDQKKVGAIAKTFVW